jgi:hypothetical protein
MMKTKNITPATLVLLAGLMWSDYGMDAQCSKGKNYL